MKNRLLQVSMIMLMLIALFKVSVHAQPNASPLHEAVLAGDVTSEG